MSSLKNGVHRRLLDLLLSPAGFSAWVTLAVFGLHSLLVIPTVSFHWWGTVTNHAWPAFVRDVLGAGHVQAELLSSTIRAAKLSARQVRLVQLVYAHPAVYLALMRLYLTASFSFILLLARFFFFLAVRPLAELRKGRIAPEMVRPAAWSSNQDRLELVVGLQHHARTHELRPNPVPIRLGLNSLRTGLIVTGTTGTGKTYGALYPYTRQFLHHRPRDPVRKPGLLILDVKGNYCDQVLQFISEVGREEDTVVIQLGGAYRYNPLHKPYLRPQVLANRLRIILETFSADKTHDSYWLDKAESMIAEAIKLSRLTSGGYVTFRDIDRLIRRKEYRASIEKLERQASAGLLSAADRETLESVMDFFLFEFEQCDERVRSIIESEVTRMTSTFTSDPLVTRTFCAPQEELNFHGFDELVDKGRIVILRMNMEEYQNLAKIMSTYLKLDFQSAVMTRLVRPGANRERPLIFINDEYHFMASRTDGRFFSVCREAYCVNVVATQSFTSLIESLGDKTAVETILQNLVNKIWLRSDDHYTIEAAQRATGKEIQYRRSESLTESGKDSNFSWVFGRSVAKDSNLSKSVSYQPVEEPIYAYDLFRRELKIMQGVAFLYTGSPPGSLESDIMTTVVHLIPFDQLPWPPPAGTAAANSVPAAEGPSGDPSPVGGAGTPQRTPAASADPPKMERRPAEPVAGVSPVVLVRRPETRSGTDTPNPPPSRGKESGDFLHRVEREFDAPQ